MTGTPAASSEAHGASQAETYLRVLAESELPHAPLAMSLPRPHRTWVAATTLAAAGAIDPDIALRVVADHEAAAMLRSTGFSRIRRPAWVSQPPAPAPPAAGPPSAVPVGAALLLPPEREGWYGEFMLMALVWSDTQAALAVSARWLGQARRSTGAWPAHAPRHVVGAVDDRGNRYQAALLDRAALRDPAPPRSPGIQDGRDWWDCCLGLFPPPPAGTRWLEVGPGAQGASVRIDLAAAATPAEVAVQPVPPVSAAARLLARAGDDLLCTGWEATVAGQPLSTRVGQVIGDLTGAGAIGRDDPAVQALVTLGWLLELDLGMGGAGGSPLPPAWISLLVDGDARDGPTGIAPFAVALPQIDGASICLAGLRSWPEGATLHVMASGWEPYASGWLAHGGGLTGEPPGTTLSWQARDSAGRWHLVRAMNWGGGHGMIQLELAPPLHPAASSLDVIITGTASAVRATVPLDWQAGQATAGSHPLRSP